MSVLSIRNFSFSYGKKEVIREVNFDVNEGEAVVLIGANGAGKSTIIKSAARILKAPQNTVFLFDKEVSQYKPRVYAQNVSYVPQTPQFASTVVLDAVVLGRLPSFSAPSGKDYAEAFSALKKVGISHLAAQNVLNLSGGEKQKVALARAICGQPKLILMDEPTSNLDLKSQYALLNTIKELSRTGVSFLLSLHDVNQAVATGDKFVLLKDQEQAASGGEEIMNPTLLEKVFELHFEKIYHGNQIHFHIKEKEEND